MWFIGTHISGKSYCVSPITLSVSGKQAHFNFAVDAQGPRQNHMRSGTRIILECHRRQKVYLWTKMVHFLESLIENWYWIGVVDDQRHYSQIFFMNTKSQLLKKMEQFFKKMTSYVTSVKYLHFLIPILFIYHTFQSLK